MARRRGRQKGFLKEEGPSWAGYWWEWDLERGWVKRHRVICPASYTQTEAQRFFNEEILDHLENLNAHCPHSTIQVKDFWRLHFEPSLKRLRPRGRQHYHTMIAGHVLPALGDLKMGEVELYHVQAFLNEKQDRYSPQTLVHLRNAMSAMFKYAKKIKFFRGELPTEGVDLPKVKRAKKRPLSPEGLQMFLTAFKGVSPLYELLLTLAVLGTRIGETVGLRWLRLNLTGEVVYREEIAFPPFTILIQDNWVRTTKRFLGPEGQDYGETKSANGLRLLPVPKGLTKALLDWHQRTKFPGLEDPVFPNRKGKPFDHDNQARAVLKPMARQLGMEWVSWHNFRHTANTAAGVVGMTMAERRDAFGWSEDRMVMHYDHSNLERIREGMERVERHLLGGGLEGKVQ